MTHRRQRSEETRSETREGCLRLQDCCQTEQIQREPCCASKADETQRFTNIEPQHFNEVKKTQARPQPVHRIGLATELQNKAHLLTTARFCQLKLKITFICQSVQLATSSLLSFMCRTTTATVTKGQWDKCHATNSMRPRWDRCHHFNTLFPNSKSP